VEGALLAGFRNMTALSSDLAVIVEALRASKDLDVSSDGFRAWWQRGQLQTWINNTNNNNNNNNNNKRGLISYS
jgi:hypothetical protein